MSHNVVYLFSIYDEMTHNVVYLFSAPNLGNYQADMTILRLALNQLKLLKYFAINDNWGYLSLLGICRLKVGRASVSDGGRRFLEHFQKILAATGLTTSRAFFVGDVNIFGMRLLIQIRYFFVNNRKTILTHWDFI